MTPPATKKRGLAAASPATRERVARQGGSAPHALRGLQAADAATRERVARAGGKAPHRTRGSPAADTVPQPEEAA